MQIISCFYIISSVIFSHLNFFGGWGGGGGGKFIFSRSVVQDFSGGSTFTCEHLRLHMTVQCAVGVLTSIPSM